MIYDIAITKDCRNIMNADTDDQMIDVITVCVSAFIMQETTLYYIYNTSSITTSRV